jgi:hypothetical protein
MMMDIDQAAKAMRDEEMSNGKQSGPLIGME